MDQGRSDGELADAMLEGEIERALAVDPSPEFLARTRMRIAADRTASHSQWSFRWMLFVAGSAAIALTGALVVWRPAPGASRPGRPGALADSRPIAAKPLDLSIVPPAPVFKGRLREGSGRLAAPVTHEAMRARSTEMEVLIAPGEAMALKRLLRGRPVRPADPSLPIDSSNEIAALQPLQEIELAPIAEISPITIEPLGSVAREEGARQ